MFLKGTLPAAGLGKQRAHVTGRVLLLIPKPQPGALQPNEMSSNETSIEKRKSKVFGTEERLTGPLGHSTRENR